MNSLTTEQIARVFAMYCEAPNPIIYPSDNPIRDDFEKQKPSRFNWSVVAGTHYGVRNTRLSLRPLSSISDEDALEIAYMEGLADAVVRRSDNRVGLKDEQYLLNIYFDGEMGLYNDGTPTYHATSNYAYQFLVQRGYAIPLYFSPGHPDNGKDAITLGLAIDSSLQSSEPCTK